ncbi:MAG: ATP-binding cassette domain-containing protein [Polyangiaceae bacterium]|nr:ATP-binding cassette domain-containing protein [Polyangiaceae bacterium]
MILDVLGFGVELGDRVVLDDVTFSMGESGVLALMGPGGGGKSTLLRAIAGMQTAGDQRDWGVIQYRGVREESRPFFIAQKLSPRSTSLERACLDLRSYGTPERRSLAEIVKDLRIDLPASTFAISMKELTQRDRALGELVLGFASGEPLLLVDEPTMGLCDEDREPVLDAVARIGAERALLLVTHNQLDARRVARTTALLAGGTIQELQPTELFFRAPISDAAQRYVKTGSCALPSPNPRRRPSSPPGAPPVRAPLKGFHWVEAAGLCGLRRPGLYGAVEEELRALRAVGVDVLICLEEQVPIPGSALARSGVELIHFPIPDMGAPDPQKTRALCATIKDLRASGRVVGIHCRGGLGRTGTILASVLITRGLTAAAALARIRASEPKYVQSEAQEAFLRAFELNFSTTESST